MNRKDIDMLKNIEIGTLLIIIGVALGVGGYRTRQQYLKNPQITSTKQVKASSSLYQSVRKNDLSYLHKIGNKSAKQANIDYAMAYAARRQGINVYDGNDIPMGNFSSYLNKNYLKNHMKYHPDKYGNYWSYFENHTSIMPDDYDIGNNENSTSNSEGGMVSQADQKHSGMVVNEKVLENHGVNSGVNFSYYTGR